MIKAIVFMGQRLAYYRKRRPDDYRLKVNFVSKL